MIQTAEWIAPLATMFAAILTAANLGTRVTGWGFVVFAFGSIAWLWVGWAEQQTGLIATNAALLVVNLFGAWRWLGRQARHERGGERAARRSARSPAVPSLFSAAALSNADVIGTGGAVLGQVVDMMLDCDEQRPVYIVVGTGGLAGAGETLRAVAASHFRFGEGAVRCALGRDAFARLPPVAADAWPEVAPAPEALPR